MRSTQTTNVGALKSYPYWLDSTPARQRYDTTVLPDVADVVIIGGGYTGLSAALCLSQSGANVAVVEKEVAGYGASTRNAGMLTTVPKCPLGQLVKGFGIEHARRLFNVPRNAIGFVEDLVRRESIDCEFARLGQFVAAYRAAHFRTLIAKREVMVRIFDYDATVVPPGHLEDEIGSSFYHGGLVYADAAAVHPGKLLAGLLDAAVRAGVGVHERAGVQRIERQGDRFVIDTARGVVRASSVLVATNGYADMTVPALRRRIIPIPSCVIVTEPLDPAVAQRLIPKHRMVVDTKNFRYYFRVTADDRLLFGGRAGFAPLSPVESAESLRRGICRVFPELMRARIEYSWNGWLAYTFDKLPHLGVWEGIYYSMGYCGSGVAMGIYLGAKIADLIAGRPTEVPLAGLRFPSMLLYRRRTWFLPAVSAYYRVRDLI